VATNLITLADRAITPLRSKAKTILNAVDLTRLQPHTRPTLSLKGTVIGSAGLFRYKKGLLYLFKALASLQGHFEYTILLAGDFFSAADRQPHMQYLDDYGLRDCTIITGKIPPGQMADYLQLFDILVFPSLFSEGCPLSMLEGMAMQKAVIGSRTGAIPEIIRHRDNGLLVNPGSSQELSQAIMELVGNPTLRQRLAENAAKQISEMTPAQELREWLDVYTAVCGEA
jgi:glycosyltransferase involved in cell wall biosynthesis